MKTIHALLFGAGHPATGLAVAAHFDGALLVVADTGLQLPAAQLVISVGGVEEPELYLNWLDGAGAQASLKPLTSADIETLMATAPEALQPQFSKWHQRKRNTRQIWGWMGGLAALCVVAVVALWLGYPALTGWLAQQVPVPLEEKLGQAALAQLRLEDDLIEKGPAQQTVQSIGAQLTQGSPYHYRWIIKQDKTVNAFAMPGGIVVVHTGLLALTSNPGELAAVLAHEVQHIEQRHTLKKMMSSLGLAAIVFVAVGDVSSVAAAVAHQVGSNYFSRDLEDDADRRGLQALLRANIAPDGMPAFFRKLDQHKGRQDGLSMPAWLTSHPATAQRIAGIERLIRQQPCPACRPLTVAGDWKTLVTSGQ